MKRIAVLASGSGSNLQAILDACADGMIQGRVVVVVANRKAAYAFERARIAGVPTEYAPLKPYTDRGAPRENYDRDLAGCVAAYQPDLVVLAGWMHVLSPAFLDCFPQRVINLHPALPGALPGVNAIERAFEAYQRGEITESGCMVHYVIPEIDAGAVIDSAVVPFQPEDTLESYAARMHAAEHGLIVQAITKVLIDS